MSDAFWGGMWVALPALWAAWLAYQNAAKAASLAHANNGKIEALQRNGVCEAHKIAKIPIDIEEQVLQCMRAVRDVDLRLQSLENRRLPPIDSGEDDEGLE